MKLNGLVSFLYRLARKMNDIDALTSGSPKKMARRAKNKYVGRKMGKIWRWPF